MRLRQALRFQVFLILGLMGFRPAFAQSSWGTSGAALCTDPAVQMNPRLCTDDSLGAIVVWRDFRKDASGDLFAARVLADGSLDPRWPANGLVVCDTAGTQQNAVIASDGNGGAYIAWEDERTDPLGEIVAVHLLGDGTVAPGWTAGGTRVCATGRGDTNPAIVSDGNGGAIVAWQDSRQMQPSIDIYAEHLKSDEIDHLWPANGKQVCNLGADQTLPIIVSDGEGGAYIGYQNQTHIGAQHLGSTGLTMWGVGGLAITSAAGSQDALAIASDGPNAFFAWLQHPTGNVFTQKIRYDGVALWTSSGRGVPAGGFAQSTPSVAPDFDGGAIITWSDARSGTSSDVWASHMLSPGSLDTSPGWPTNGLSIGGTADSETNPIAISDGSGGEIIEWETSTAMGARALRIQEDGGIAPGWPAGGFALSSAGSSQQHAIIADGGGGVLVAWRDLRTSANGDIYAQRADGTGVPVSAGPGPAIAGLALGSPWPNPARTKVALTFKTSAPIVSCWVFDVEGRSVRRLSAAGEHEFTWDLRSASGQRVPAGLYFIRVATRSTAETRKVLVAP